MQPNTTADGSRYITTSGMKENTKKSSSAYLPMMLNGHKLGEGFYPLMQNIPGGKEAFQNHLGAYYCNFNRLVQNPPDTNRAAVNNGINEIVGRISRGAFLLCPVKSFAPNSIGLYNMCGNIAEMLELEKRTKGGGWDSDSKFMSINALDEYNGKTTPNPYTGFRVFMQVIEK
jgi:hypothetical protein